MIPAPMTIGDLAGRLAGVTGASEDFHARQLRAIVRAGALTPTLRGGSGVTAPALFDEAGLCRAMILHTLAGMGQDMPILQGVAGAMKVFDPRSRKGDVVEPSDPVELAVKRIRSGFDMFLHVEFSNWPIPEADIGVSGWISDTAVPLESKPMPRRAWIVLPLHTILRPLLGMPD